MISRRAALRSGYTQLLLLLSGADADTMDLLRRRITALCTGWEVAQIRAIVAETLHEIVDPLVYAEAADLIEEHRAAGRLVVTAATVVLTVVAAVLTAAGAAAGAGRSVCFEAVQRPCVPNRKTPVTLVSCARPHPCRRRFPR